jgi:hypothetical protein
VPQVLSARWLGSLQGDPRLAELRALAERGRAEAMETFRACGGPALL